VQYTVPKKYIVALEDVQVFQKTSIYAELTTFLIDLQAVSHIKLNYSQWGQRKLQILNLSKNFMFFNNILNIYKNF